MWAPRWGSWYYSALVWAQDPRSPKIAKFFDSRWAQHRCLFFARWALLIFSPPWIIRTVDTERSIAEHFMSSPQSTKRSKRESFSFRSFLLTKSHPQWPVHSSHPCQKIKEASSSWKLLGVRGPSWIHRGTIVDHRGTIVEPSIKKKLFVLLLSFLFLGRRSLGTTRCARTLKLSSRHALRDDCRHLPFRMRERERAR